MKTHRALDCEDRDPDLDADWMETVAVARWTPAEVARLRRALAGRPAELRRLEQELALNELLDDPARAPQPASNFGAQVQQRVLAAERAKERTGRSWAGRESLSGWLAGAGRVWPLWASALLAVGWMVGWQVREQRHRGLMAEGAAAVASVVTSPGLSAENLEDYEAIRRLGVTAQPADDALIVALLEGPRP